MKTVLSIAGSDPSGGAGIQADIKTISAFGVFAMAAVSALTAQNTLGVQGIFCVPADFLKMQIRSVVCDILPDATKIGLLPSAQSVCAVADCVREFSLKNVVVDTVFASTSGAEFSSSESILLLKKNLLPLSILATPNLGEAEILSNRKIFDKNDIESAAKTIFDECGCAVLVKGGHFSSGADDFLFDGKNARWFLGERIENPNTHGTGCTLSSAICANLALGRGLFESVENAKSYLSSAISARLKLGHGRGPLNHFWNK